MQWYFCVDGFDVYTCDIYKYSYKSNFKNNVECRHFVYRINGILLGVSTLFVLKNFWYARRRYSKLPVTVWHDVSFCMFYQFSCLVYCFYLSCVAFCLVGSYCSVCTWFVDFRSIVFYTSNFRMSFLLHTCNENFWLRDGSWRYGNCFQCFISQEIRIQNNNRNGNLNLFLKRLWLVPCKLRSLFFILLHLYPHHGIIQITQQKENLYGKA